MKEKKVVDFKGHVSPPPKNPRQKCCGFLFVLKMKILGMIINNESWLGG